MYKFKMYVTPLNRETNNLCKYIYNLKTLKEQFRVYHVVQLVKVYVGFRNLLLI